MFTPRPRESEAASSPSGRDVEYERLPPSAIPDRLDPSKRVELEAETTKLSRRTGAAAHVQQLATIPSTLGPARRRRKQALVSQGMAHRERGWGVAKGRFALWAVCAVGSGG